MLVDGEHERVVCQLVALRGFMLQQVVGPVQQAVPLVLAALDGKLVQQVAVHGIQAKHGPVQPLVVVVGIHFQQVEAATDKQVFKGKLGGVAQLHGYGLAVGQDIAHSALIGKLRYLVLAQRHVGDMDFAVGVRLGHDFHGGAVDGGASDTEGKAL